MALLVDERRHPKKIVPSDLSSDSKSEFCDESLWLQKVMRGISRSPKLLAPSANQILPSLFRYNTFFTQIIWYLGSHMLEDMNWPEHMALLMCSGPKKKEWIGALRWIESCFIYPGSSMGLRENHPWTAPCWQFVWPTRGNQSPPVKVIIRWNANAVHWGW